MGKNVAQKLIESHLVSGKMTPGSEIGIRIDQTLTQDATGTLVMLELEAMGLDRARTELSAQYVDHNLLQTDEKNADDHLFLYSACQRFGIPGKTMCGSDSHTPAAGSLGMLAIGVGGLEVALAMTGEPLYIKMPEIWGVKIVGELPDWVSAKDAILEMLRRHDVHGGRGRIIEYYGPGLDNLTAMDRHVIANMGAELGATTTVFPSDDEVRRFLASEERDDAWSELVADDDASYDVAETIDLSTLEPLIARPSSPGNVVPVREVAGEDVFQAVIGSSANPGLRDFGIAAMIVDGKQAHPRVSFDVNPTSRQILESMIEMRFLASLVRAGARVHQSGCMGCIGMGQAPATGRNSLRTVPRNFPGRSGAREDSVFLCSPETAAASALTGVITDPRELESLYDMKYPRFKEPKKSKINADMLVAPPPSGDGIELIKGPNISTLPEFDPLPDEMQLEVLLKVGDNISTDEIMPAGERVLPYRSNIPRISDFTYDQIDETYSERAKKLDAGHAVVGGNNYGQGSSREHAAIAPRYLGLRAVLVKNFARIHWQNLINFGILPLEFADETVYDDIGQGDVLSFANLRKTIESGNREIDVENITKGRSYTVTHGLSERQAKVVLAGGLIPVFQQKLAKGSR